MAHTTAQKVQSFLQATKLTVSSLDVELEETASDEVIGQIAAQLDVSTWADNTSTPDLVQRVIAMYYAAWTINKVYAGSEEGVDPYAAVLLRRADLTIAGILTGSTILLDVPAGTQDVGNQPVFYPNDTSDALDSSDVENGDGSPDTSVGMAKFSMGSIF
jgi:hypothetical protein